MELVELGDLFVGPRSFDEHGVFPLRLRLRPSQNGRIWRGHDPLWSLTMADHPFLALVTPMAHGLIVTPITGHVEHPIAPGGPPPSVGIPGFPTPPIAPGGPPPVVGGGPIMPPGIWPPPGHPDHDLPPIPPVVPDGSVLVLVYIPGQGATWVVVDTNLKPTNPIVLPPTVNPPDQPPTATPAS